MSHFTVEKITRQLSTIKSAIYREVVDLPVFHYLESKSEYSSLPALDGGAWRDIRVGDAWGGYDVWAWFCTQTLLPEGWRKARVYLRLLMGPRNDGGSTAEALLYVNGRILQGIDVWHMDAWLPPEILAAGELNIAVRAWSGVLHVPQHRHFHTAQLIRVDEDAENLYYLTDTLLRTLKAMDENDLRYSQILNGLHEAYLQIDFRLPGSEAFDHSARSALDIVREMMMVWQELNEIKPVVVGVGHAHIDMAWLWRLQHTREKAARTFSTALHLMREYPEYRFLHSSPQLYQFIQQDYPEIFEQVKAQIACGNWEITGATWVEMDTNITGGESLVRQFLFGRRYVRETFGLEMKLLWLPDVFGYSAALPQIIRKSGIKYFATTKISWSQFNRFPNDTFYWRGLDGTEVLTHFITTPEEGSGFYTYNGSMRPDEVRGIWQAYRQKEFNQELLLSFGWGDGGGGPTREMLEWAQAQKNIPGQPKVELGKAEPYFDRLAERLADKKLPVWDGELYLEYHRGTYTSQAAIKRANRKAEILYHNAEWLSALASIMTGQEHYPVERLNAGWEKILLNQFHDILPGSSIHQVYEDAADDYAEISKIGDEVLEQASQAILNRMQVNSASVAVFNPTSWQRDDLIALPLTEELSQKTLLGPGGDLCASQVIETEGGQQLLLEAKSVPAYGYRIFPLVPAQGETASPITVSPDYLENTWVQIRLNQLGQITSLFDRKNDRELLPAGCRANVLQVFEDKPMKFDAWDIDIYYQDKMREITDLREAVVEEVGPLRGTLRLTWQFGNSTITQRLRIYAHTPRIDFDTEVEWHEAQILLKVAFPVELRATRATYDIQFGNIERPTHWNTSWDWARFEVSGHKWADLSEGNYGAALLNDCKYGYDIKDNVMRLTLIKSAIEPDAQADQGQHLFTYSLLPHRGDWRVGEVARRAYELNMPLLAKAPALRVHANALPDEVSLAVLDCDHVILETIKRAENGEGWVLRLYEYQQMHVQNVRLNLGLAIERAAECDLMEENEQPVAYSDHQLVFDISPYEIKTFKVWFKK